MTSELKTLKDKMIEKALANKEACLINHDYNYERWYDGHANAFSLFYDEIKKLAVENVLEIRKQKDAARKKSKAGRPGIYLEMDTEGWIMHFFNITEEDLK